MVWHFRAKLEKIEPRQWPLFEYSLPVIWINLEPINVGLNLNRNCLLWQKAGCKSSDYHYFQAGNSNFVYLRHLAKRISSRRSEGAKKNTHKEKDPTYYYAAVPTVQMWATNTTVQRRPARQKKLRRPNRLARISFVLNSFAELSALAKWGCLVERFSELSANKVHLSSFKSGSKNQARGFQALVSFVITEAKLAAFKLRTLN